MANNEQGETALARVLADMGIDRAGRRFEFHRLMADEGFEIEYKRRRPADVILPGFGLADDIFETHEPVGSTVTVAGIAFRLVNWFDYRGVEVRLAQMLAKPLGYINSVIKSDGAQAFEATDVEGPSVAEFARADEAITYLYQRSLSR